MERPVAEFARDVIEIGEEAQERAREIRKQVAARSGRQGFGRVAR